MLSASFNSLFVVCLCLVMGCRQSPEKGSADSAAASVLPSSTVVAIRALPGRNLQLSQISVRSLFDGIKCILPSDSQLQSLDIVPAKPERLLSASGQEYFVQLKMPLKAETCQGEDAVGQFDYRSFFVTVGEVELLQSSSISPAPLPVPPASADDLKSARSEALARDMERRRSGGNKPCGLTSFGQRGCWACVGWAMTDTGIFPSGLGADADATPNGFLRATRTARTRKDADGTININGKRFRSLLAEFRTTPSLAPRGSILFCNTSEAGHAAVMIDRGNEMRSDVIETLATPHRQSLCWEQVQEILFPLD